MNEDKEPKVSYFVIQSFQDCCGLTSAGKLSPTQLLTHCPPGWDGERIRKVTKLVG